MFGQKLLIVVLSFSCLLTASNATANQAGDDQSQPRPSAAELYRQGLQKFSEGEYEQAKELLLQVDGAQLPREDHVTLWETIQDIDRRLSPSSQTPSDLLKEAEAMRKRGETNESIVLYKQVATHPDASAAQKDSANARLAEIDRVYNPEMSQVKSLLDEVKRDIDAGRLDVAQNKLQTVRTSGVKLGQFDETRVDRYNRMIADRQGGVAQPVAAQNAAVREAAQPQPAEQENQNEQQPAPAATQPQPAPAQPAQQTPPQQGSQSDLLSQTASLFAQQEEDNGDVAMREGNHRVAIMHYERALSYNPDNAEVRAKLDAAQRQAGTISGGRTMLDIGRQEQEIRRQELEADYEDLMNRARQSLAENNFQRANEYVAQAKLVIQRNENLLTPVAYQQRIAAAEQLTADIENRRVSIETNQAIQSDRELQRDRTEAQRQADRERRQRVDQLLVRAYDLQQIQQYDEALTLLNQVLFIDPNNIAAQLMKQMIEDNRLYVEYRRTRRVRDLEIATLKNENLKATIPWNKISMYPDDWPQLSYRRLQAMDSGSDETEENRQARASLRQSVPVNFEATRLSLVIDFLRNTTGLNFFVNWPALQNAGVDEDTPISLQLSNIPAEQALRLVLQQASIAAFEPIGYSIIEGVVTISTITNLSENTDIQIYDIRDLLVQVPNFSNAPIFDLESALDSSSGGGRSGGGGGGGGGSGSSIFTRENQQQDAEELSRVGQIEQILELIRTTVGKPEDWEFFGGTVSSVREMNGNLIIRTTPDNHRQTMRLLTQLREALSVQIAVEARFLLVDQNFLHEVGVNFDVTISNSVFGTDKIGDIDISNNTRAMADRQTTALTPGGFGPSSGNDDEEVTTYARSFTMGVNYLDNIQANLVIDATVANHRAVTLTAPRVTLFNGQRAYVLVARQIAFISDLTPVPDTLGFDIDPGVVNSGVVLDVQATVSADRRYVTMTLRPSLSSVTQPMERVPIAAGFAVPNDGGGGGGADDVTVAEAFIELPELEITEVRTTVSVPDRGTLMIGGQRLVGEIEIEAGVPVLSKIPLVNRLFTNTSTVKDERTLLILVKPTIIIQSEEEDVLFPGLRDNPSRYGTGRTINQ